MAPMSPPTPALKVVIVAENASTAFGGEAILPWHYFRLLYRRGVDVELVVHERTRGELLELLPEAADRIHFVPDLALQRWLWKAGTYLPARVAENTVGFASHLATSVMQRRLVKELVRTRGIHIVHEPIPVSPKQPSFMHDLGAPVVIGPMNGGMDYPPAFTKAKGLLERLVVGGGREASHLVNRLIPGKRRAAVLLVANQRTRNALPRTVARHVITLAENGVDLSLFTRAENIPFRPRKGVRFAFMGRLIDLKCVDLLLDALAKCPPSYELVVIGDGPMRPALEAQVQRLGLGERVTFRGHITQLQCSAALVDSDALVLPSIRECGGAVVLEAMALGLPVIATDWGGPQDYLDASTGILVEPNGPAGFVEGLRAALVRLGESPELRAQLGAAGRQRVEREFDWERKIDRMLDIYADAANLPRAAARPVPMAAPVVSAARSEQVAAVEI